MASKATDRKDAYEEDECLLCAPAPHPNCEMYTVLEVLNREHVPLGEDESDHLIEIPVCLGHYQALEEYQSGKNVAEVDVI
ncbi:hypothetical protein [Natronosalvus halobius]|uniref:hypothetical protein n=1 Tax=Natronosalvus halobius TaxID=2953746 RepID=UPI00209EF4A4|nr:hypothetical protein [Natronosalvus halobius]USZ73778.1 hypothetical protein NGM15_18400 [Natronosalvus halobius]